jgi:predicted nucleotidyltransferase component of viral defense system
MNKTTRAYRQVQLLVRLLPFVRKQECFALKGGTAINLFVRDLPRLSVDIDIHYLPRESYKVALTPIWTAMHNIQEDIQRAIPGIRIQTTNSSQTGSGRIILTHNGSQIKIEISPVSRGTVWPSQIRETVRTVEEEFGFAENQVVSFYDLYAGKICAALDRQHPRDLFDIKLLLENEGINRDLFKTFLVYIVSHNRPMAELLNPSRKDIRGQFTNEFREMTREAVTFEEILEVRDKLIGLIHTTLTDGDREFLLSVKRRTPDWSLLEMDGIEDLPALQWKLTNLRRMTAEQHAKALKRLEVALQKTAGLPRQEAPSDRI